MARIYTNGFERQTLTADVEWDTNTLTATAFTNIDTTTTRNSAASLLAINTNFIGFQAYDTVSGSDHYVSFDYRIIVQDNSSNIFARGCYSTFNNQYLWELSTTSAGVLTLKNRAGTVVGSGSTLSPGTWYRIEVFQDFASTSPYSIATVRIDGVDDIGPVAVGDATASGIMSFWFGSLTPLLGGNHWAYWDNIRINNNQGSLDNSWCGEGYILQALPDADGGEQDWAIGAGAGAHWTLVDEPSTFDDATTYVVRTSTGTALTVTELFKISAPALLGAGDTVKFVAIGTRNGSNSNTTGNRTARLVMTSQAGGTQVDNGLNLNWSINGWGTNYTELTGVTKEGSAPGQYQFIRYTTPQSDTSWTKATVDTAEIGATNATSSSQELRLSAIWAMIEYIPAASTGARLLTLLGVGT